MAIKVYELDNGLGNLIFGEGEIAADEYYEVIMQHLSKPDEQLKKYIYSISDYAAVTSAEIGLSHITKIAQKSIEVSKINPGVIVAIVASNSIVYGMAKIWSGLAKLTGWTMNVFRTREEADTWMKKKLIEKHGDIQLEFDSNLTF